MAFVIEVIVIDVQFFIVLSYDYLFGPNCIYLDLLITLNRLG